MKLIVRVFHIVTFALVIGRSNAIFASDQSQVANALGWKSGPCNQDHTLCGGYYSEPPSLKSVPKPPPYKTVPVTVSATGPIIFRPNGTSVLQDNVIVRQPGRLIHADKAVITHDKKTGDITDIQLLGHVSIQEDGKLFVSDKADYNVTKDTIKINKIIFHIVGKHQLLHVTTPFDAWGTAEEATREKDGVINLKHATYSTCSPADPTWVITAGSMRLDRNTEKGSAENIVLRFKKIPILYSPYFTFPLSYARKSGFLPPTAGYETQAHGFFFGEPYYWNIAPNYDLMFTPKWYTKRGLQLNENFRYLTDKSDGFLYASFMTSDRYFQEFKQNTIASYGPNPSPVVLPYLSQLSSSSDHRAFFDFENHYNFSDAWDAKVYIRYLTDPYFMEDFQSEYLTQNTNQLPSFAELNYHGSHWHDTLLISEYQTLHPLEELQQTPALNQYTRLPEFDSRATYPDFIPNWNFNFSGQAVDFDYSSAFSPQTYQVPIGDRFHLQPSISRPFNWSSFHLTPQLTADNVTYVTQLPSETSTSSRPDYDASRTLPIFDIDSGWYLDRSTRFGENRYLETLEPRLFYLYIPYLNQNNYPNFDTQLLPFSPSNLYTLNEFAGFDRIQNANQVTLGLTSHLLRESDASNILTGQLGIIDYFEQQKVCLTNNCEPTAGRLSPLTGALTWNPNPLWSFTTQGAWDTALGQMNNAQIGTEYRLAQREIIVLNYQFAHSSPDNPFDAFGVTSNASLITAGLLWPLTSHWNFFGYTYYDLTNGRPVSQYVGLGYSTCCWALRMLVSDDYNGPTQVAGGQLFQSTYTTNYYVQFSLTGLGSVGNRDAETILRSTLPGYQDSFSNHGHYSYSTSL